MRGLAWLAAALVLLAGCVQKRSRALPQSSGSPYSVAVVGTDTASVAVVADVMGEFSEIALPQDEPSFDVSRVAGKPDEGTLLTPVVIEVKVDPSRYPATAMQWRENVYARPQLVVTLTTPAAETLQKELQRNVGLLVRQLGRFGVDTEQARLESAHNVRAEELVSKMFGCRMLVPAELKAMKQGRRFLWLSDAATGGQLNICISDADSRDSVWKANIRGEKDNMYMTTVGGTVRERTEEVDGRQRLVRAGLWEMKDDAMGGPFRSHVVVDSATGRTIVADAFVYAPGKRKRDMMRRLEASLYTLAPVH
ncbi:MAG: DUF4837 family protein [Prevotella sp.]